MSDLEHRDEATRAPDILSDLANILLSREGVEQVEATEMDYRRLEQAVLGITYDNPHDLHTETLRKYPGASMSTRVRPETWSSEAPRFYVESMPRNGGSFQLRGNPMLSIHLDGSAADGTPFETAVEVYLRDNDVAVMLSGNSGKDADGRNRGLSEIGLSNSSIYKGNVATLEYLTDMLKQPMVSAETEKERRQRKGGIILSTLKKLGW